MNLMWLISIDWHWPLTYDPDYLGRPIPSIVIPLHQFLWPYLVYFLIYQLWSSLNLMDMIWLISIDWHWPLTYNPGSLGRPISNIVISLHQVSWPYLSYFLVYEFWSSLNFEGVTDDRQKVMYKSPLCHWHRWAQKLECPHFGRVVSDLHLLTFWLMQSSSQPKLGPTVLMHTCLVPMICLEVENSRPYSKYH